MQKREADNVRAERTTHKNGGTYECLYSFLSSHLQEHRVLSYLSRLSLAIEVELSRSVASIQHSSRYHAYNGDAERRSLAQLLISVVGGIEQGQEFVTFLKISTTMLVESTCACKILPYILNSSLAVWSETTPFVTTSA